LVKRQMSNGNAVSANMCLLEAFTSCQTFS
jgi:hypothetical protein